MCSCSAISLQNAPQILNGIEISGVWRPVGTFNFGGGKELTCDSLCVCPSTILDKGEVATLFFSIFAIHFLRTLVYCSPLMVSSLLPGGKMTIGPLPLVPTSDQVVISGPNPP